MTVHVLHRFLVISNYFEHKKRYLPIFAGCVSIAAIATVYGLNCPGIEYRRMRDFLYQSRPAPGPTQPPVQWVPFILLGCGVKRLGIGVNHPRPSRTEVKERVEVYFCSPCGPSWPVIEWNLRLPLPLVFWPSILWISHFSASRRKWSQFIFLHSTTCLLE